MVVPGVLLVRTAAVVRSVVVVTTVAGVRSVAVVHTVTNATLLRPGRCLGDLRMVRIARLGRRPGQAVRV